MDFVQQAALAGSLAWASGFRLYAVVFAAGLLSRLGYLHLPDSLQVLQAMPVIAVAGILCTLEFLADKVPWVD